MHTVGKETSSYLTPVSFFPNPVTRGHVAHAALQSPSQLPTPSPNSENLLADTKELT